jgi:hypothetical protein
VLCADQNSSDLVQQLQVVLPEVEAGLEISVESAADSVLAPHPLDAIARQTRQFHNKPSRLSVCQATVGVENEEEGAHISGSFRSNLRLPQT